MLFYDTAVTVYRNEHCCGEHLVLVLGGQYKDLGDSCPAFLYILCLERNFRDAHIVPCAADGALDMKSRLVMMSCCKQIIWLGIMAWLLWNLSPGPEMVMTESFMQKQNYFAFSKLTEDTASKSCVANNSGVFRDMLDQIFSMVAHPEKICAFYLE